jgi:hypothetical protein
MAKSTFRARSRSNRLGAVEVISPQLHRSWLVQALLVLWRWSIEITLAVLLFIAWFRLAAVMPNYAVAMVMAFPLVTVCNFRWGRRFIVGWFFVLMVRHRIRTALVQLGSRNRSGKLPWLVLWCPTPVGERVWLALVAGMSPEQIEESADALAAACWARQVRVEKNRRMTAFVRVDVIRYDPLESSKPIGSRLLGPLRRVHQPQPPAIAGTVGEYQPGPLFGSGSYGKSRLYRANGHLADSSDNRKPSRASRDGRGDDSSDDDDGGLSDYV